MEEYPELRYRDIKEKERMSFWAGVLLGVALASIMWVFTVNYIISLLIN